MNNIEHLITLANRISAFFDAFPDRDEALEGVANHIQKFWDPRMRIALLGFLENRPDGTKGDVALSATALEAITLNKERLTPRTRLSS